MSLNISHSVDSPPISFPPVASSPTSSHQIWSQTKLGHNISANNTSAENSLLWVTNGGGNFVDMSLKVVIEQATDTLLNFDPTRLHVTTWLCEAHNYMVSITFSAHIMAAFKNAEHGMAEAGEGAGDGDFDQSLL